MSAAIPKLNQVLGCLGIMIKFEFYGLRTL